MRHPEERDNYLDAHRSGKASHTARNEPFGFDMFDGQTLFDTCTAFSKEQELQVDETVTRVILESRIQPMIVVGIDSSSRRPHEYRPHKDSIADPTAPEPLGKELPAFVVNEVMAHVSARYRVTAIQHRQVSLEHLSAPSRPSTSC